MNLACLEMYNNDNVDGNIEAYIEKEKTDMVIVLYQAGTSEIDVCLADNF